MEWDYLLKNQIINEHPKLTKFLVDDYLSRSEIKKACEIFLKIKSSIQDEYLSKFNIYCLINSNKNEEAQLQFDLLKEIGIMATSGATRKKKTRKQKNKYA